MTSQDLGSAQQILSDSGFGNRVNFTDTNDPQNDGLVLSQLPAGGTQLKPGSNVTLTVGRYTAPGASAADDDRHAADSVTAG